MATAMINEVIGAVQPLLEENGFRRKGRRLHYAVSEAGDVAVVYFQRVSAPYPGEEGFYVNYGLAPRPWIDWIDRWVGGSGRTEIPSIGHCAWRERLQTPEGTKNFAGFDAWDEWSVSAPGGAPWAMSVGSAAELIEQELRESAVPMLQRLFERDFLVTQCPGVGRLLRVAFLADRGPSAELAEILDRDFARDTEDEPANVAFAAWLREWVRSR